MALEEPWHLACSFTPEQREDPQMNQSKFFMLTLSLIAGGLVSGTARAECPKDAKGVADAACVAAEKAAAAAKMKLSGSISEGVARAGGKTSNASALTVRFENADGRGAELSYERTPLRSGTATVIPLALNAPLVNSPLQLGATASRINLPGASITQYGPVARLGTLEKPVSFLGLKNQNSFGYLMGNFNGQSPDMPTGKFSGFERCTNDVSFHGLSRFSLSQCTTRGSIRPTTGEMGKLAYRGNSVGLLYQANDWLGIKGDYQETHVEGARGLYHTTISAKIGR
jgi:hypothetical protein